MNNVFAARQILKMKLRQRERLFGGWVSYSHPSITETFAQAGFDLMFIDMEHSTISLEQAQRIIAASQSEGVPCLPRPVSHSNDFIKPLLDSGADGLLIQMVETEEQVKSIIKNSKYPPDGGRTFGVNRAQGYGFHFEEYIKKWNESSCLIIQVESVTGVQNINSLLSHEEVDGVMIGPLDISGSLGVPGQVDHPSVVDASKQVIDACKRFGKSCGTQIADVSEERVEELFGMGYTYLILASDLFAITSWSKRVQGLMENARHK